MQNILAYRRLTRLNLLILYAKATPKLYKSFLICSIVLQSKIG